MDHKDLLDHKVYKDLLGHKAYKVLKDRLELQVQLVLLVLKEIQEHKELRDLQE